MEELLPARCQVLVNKGDSRWTKREACGRPVERDGKCKMHLRVEERRAEKNKKWREDYERGKDLQAEATALGAAIGAHVEAHYDSIRGTYDGRFVVEGGWLRAQEPDDV